MSAFNLEQLESLIEQRKSATAEASYTRSLLEAGLPKIARKFGEEAIELIIAVLHESREAQVAEAADVLYHLLVLLREKNIPLRDVLETLEKRTHQSGHQEKSLRSK